MGKTYSNVNGTGISTYHLSETPELYEPSRSNAFEFVLDLTNQNAAFSNNKVQGTDTADALLAAGTGAATVSDDSADYLTGVSDVIRLSVSEAFVPHFDLGVIEIKRGNSTMKFAGTPTFNDGTLKCNDYVGAKTKDYLLAWQRMAYDVVNDVVELAGNYKRNCTLIEYAPDFSRIIRQWTLYGCWVKSLSEGSFSHESNDKRSIDVTIVYDRAVPLNVPALTGSVNDVK